MPEKPEPAEWNKKLQEEASSTAFQLISRWVERGVGWAKQKIEWERAASQYVERWLDRWGQIQPLGADRPIPLLQIFVNVRAVPASFLKRFTTVEEIEWRESIVREGRERDFFGLSDERQKEYHAESGIAIANEHERLNLLGAPGAGKSTFLRRLGLEALLRGRETNTTFGQPKYHHAVIPVLVELRSLRNTPIAKPDDVVALIVAEFSNAGFPASPQIVTSALKEGGLLILLDGVDEIPGKYLEESIKAIRDFIHLYKQCRYVLSCRTAFYREWFTGFRDYVLADFDNGQVAQFARNWFNRPQEIQEDVAKKFLSLLNSEDHRATRELGGSPLLLTFLSLVFRKTQQFPPNRAQLYQKALRIYLEEWNASKLVHNDPIYNDLSPEMELELLKDIAGPAFIENHYFFTRAELTAGIQQFLTKELNAPRSLSPGQILDAIAVQQGLLIERAQDTWTFSHLTIQEYLAAAWILEEGQADELILKYTADDRWREIFLLMAGLARADDMLLLMMTYAESLLGNDTFGRFVEALRSLASKESAYMRGKIRLKSGATISAIVSEAFLRILALGAVVARAWSDTPDQIRQRAVGVVVSFERAEGIDLVKDTSQTLISRFAEDLRLTYGVDRDIVVRYCTACALVCDCKRAALRVSLDAWEAVCTRFVRPRESDSVAS